MVKLVFVSLGMLFTGEAGVADLSGPVGVVNAMNTAAQTGWFNFLFFAAFLAVNIGIMNLLPLPALDGGRILFVLIELITGRPVPKEREGLIHFIGFAVLILLMIFVPNSVNAAGYISTGTKSLTIEIGSSKTFTITAYNAVGDVKITSSDTSIAKVSSSSFETGAVGDGATKKGTITVTGVSVGTTKIKLDVSGATFDGEKLNDQDQEIVVTVVEKKIDSF